MQLSEWVPADGGAEAVLVRRSDERAGPQKAGATERSGAASGMYQSATPESTAINAPVPRDLQL